MARPVTLALGFVGLLLLGIVLAVPPARAAGYPTLPLADEGRFVADLSAPVLGPGGSGAVTFSLSNPLASAITAVVFSFEVYAFNALPGNATGPVPSSGEPTFSGGSPGPSSTQVQIASLAPGARFSAPGDVSVTVSVPSSAPSGTYAIRTSLDFTSAGQVYLLESRGFFTASQWASATVRLPNGTAALDASRLGVSGVIPETGLLVETNPVAGWLYGLLGASLLLAGAGGYAAWRRGSRSSSGARTPPPPQKARTAFGSSRTSDGD